MASRRRTSSRGPVRKREAEAGFAIGTYDQGLIEDNIRERVDPRHGDPVIRREWAEEGLIDANGELTYKGSGVLSQDIGRLERNATAWLAHKFSHIRLDGHDSHGDLVGNVWFDPTNPTHAYLIELASEGNERIDMADSSYGDLAHTAFDGVSDFGASVLGGSITFFDVQPEDMEIIENTTARSRAPRRRR